MSTTKVREALLDAPAKGSDDIRSIPETVEGLALLLRAKAASEPTKLGHALLHAAANALVYRRAALDSAAQEDAGPVAWYAQGICRMEFVDPVAETVKGFIERRNAEQDAGGVSPQYRLRGPFPLYTTPHPSPSGPVAKDYFGELCAVVFRDGGHHLAEVGRDAALEEAIAEVVNTRARLESFPSEG